MSSEQRPNGNDNATSILENGASQEEQTQNRPRSRVSIAIENFSFLWFTISMNTGILSILMHQNPYQFRGLGILSTIMFVFNIVLFAFFVFILLLRIILFPQKLLGSLKTDLTELSMLGTIPIAWFTLVAQVGLTVSTASWGSHAFTLVAYVMWWIGTAVMLSVAVVVFIVVLKFDVTDTSRINPTLVIPFVGTATDAVVGGLIVSFSAEVSSRIAVPVIVVSYLLLGLGFFAAIIIFAIVFIRLLEQGIPGAQTPSMFLFVGPPGQSASAMLLLGSAAKMHFPGYMKGSALTEMGGAAFSAIGVLFGLMFVGLAVYFMICALYLIIDAGRKKQHSYSLLWWGTIFPLATVNTAWISLATAMDSPTFRVLSTIFLLALFVDYFVNWAFTVYHLTTGRLLNLKRSENSTRERQKEQ